MALGRNALIRNRRFRTIEEQFENLKGPMGPKVAAAMQFVVGGGRRKGVRDQRLARILSV